MLASRPRTVPSITSSPTVISAPPIRRAIDRDLRPHLALETPLEIADQLRQRRVVNRKRTFDLRFDHAFALIL